MNKSTQTHIKRIFDYLVRHEVIILLIAFLIFLRIPNLFEPYWMGDEAIYLVTGSGMRQDLKLYSQILDHKTPLIYYLAMVPSQFWFRILLMVWMIVTTLFFYLLTGNLKLKTHQRYISTFLFIILTTLPWLEGNLPNGELFVMGFVLAGGWVFSQTKFFQLFLEEKIVPIKSVLSNKQTLLISITGVLFSLGILTKVPALFEIIPFFMVGYFTLIDHFSIKRSRKVFFSILGLWEILGIAVVTPIVLSFVYFALRGTLSAYIDIGILYNFRYAGEWTLPKAPFGLEVLLTMKSRLFIVISSILLLTIFSKKISARSQFIIAWVMFSLFGVLLSSRPYPHYLLQVVPSLCLLLGILFQKFQKKLETLFLIIPLFLLVGSILGIQFYFYPTGKYYKNFFSYLTQRMSKEAYYQSFDGLMNDNYQVATILLHDPQPRTFIWGTNPTLYALSRKVPTGRFITAFHIADFPGAFDETYQDLTTYQPNFIVVMKKESIKFPEFYTYLYLNYVPYKDLEHMTVYKKTDFMQKDLDSL